MWDKFLQCNPNKVAPHKTNVLYLTWKKVQKWGIEMLIKCVQCGKVFDISEAEKDYYIEKGLQIPKRCLQCRQSNRINNRNSVIPRGRERRQRRRSAIKRVPMLTLLMLIAATFAFLNFVRREPVSNRRVEQEQVVSQTPLPGEAGNKERSASIQPAVMFRSEQYLKEHYEKHGREMGYESADEYLAGANAVIYHSKALHKTQKEDGDDIYYVEGTNDLVIVSGDGYIRTYFRPEDGMAYYNRQ